MSGCLIPSENGSLDGHVTSAGDGSPVAGASVTAENSLGDTYPYTTDPSGYYTLTLPADTYTVTVSADGFQPALMGGVAVSGGATTTLDFSMQPACEPLSGLDFSWLPLEPYNGEVVTFTATASGTQPIDFHWDFGDTVTATGEIVNHFYLNPNTYTVALSATNACGSAEVDHNITIKQVTHEFFLPLLNRQ
jgi:PKD repeat protein